MAALARSSRRSPRMMYHAKSFADNGFQTTLVGYAGEYNTLARALPCAGSADERIEANVGVPPTHSTQGPPSSRPYYRSQTFIPSP